MQLSNTTRILTGAGSLLLIVTFFVPLWQIMLWAPQYPEGLSMQIWHNTLSGNIDIINGLNHYIGMRHIGVEMFPEFKYIGPLLGFLIAVGLAAAVLGKGRILFFFTLLSYVYGVAALWDFWRWGYDYGHNLDPNAAIKVPDMSYQPPVIGYKNLLNFTSYSGPDVGAWIVIGVCFMATLLWWIEFFKARKVKQTSTSPRVGAVGAIILLSLFSGCASGPEPIRYGQDNCHYCKMTLTDKRFGAEVVTKKGKIFKFDDLNCLNAFLDKGEVSESEAAHIVGVDFNQPGVFVDVRQGFFLHNEAIKSPMRSDVAVFSNADDLSTVKSALGGGKELRWDALRAEL